MKRFIDIHDNMKGITKEQLEEAHRKDLAIEGQRGVHFLHAWADPKSGKVFCLSEGPDEKSVQSVHEQAGHRCDAIFEVPLEVE